MTAPAKPRRRRTRTWVTVGIALLAILGAAALTALLTSPRSGGLLDGDSTSADGAHALVSLLREQGVQVHLAGTVAEAADAAGPDTLLVVAQTRYLPAADLLARLADVDADLLLIQPSSPTRELLAPGVQRDHRPARTQPNCELRAARQAGTIDLRSATTFRALDDPRDFSSCYGGAVVRYHDGDRVITVVGASEFLQNGALTDAGNAALAMNLAGEQPRLVWYAPQRPEDDGAGSATVFQMIPQRVYWIVGQLIVVVALLALWQGRRLGPLVAERLPVVVRASETVEGRGRLYRSRRARDRAADALRAAARQRLLPRLGLTRTAGPDQILGALAAQTGMPPGHLEHLLYGPVPSGDEDLQALAHALDDIERKVAHP